MYEPNGGRSEWIVPKDNNAMKCVEITHTGNEKVLRKVTLA